MQLALQHGAATAADALARNGAAVPPAMASKALQLFGNSSPAQLQGLGRAALQAEAAAAARATAQAMATGPLPAHDE